MRDHRPQDDGTVDLTPVDITEQVRSHHVRHPGSVRRSPKAKRRAAEKRARASRRANRR